MSSKSELEPALAALDEVLAAVGRPLGPGDEVNFSGHDPILPSPFLLSAMGAAAIAACGLAASDLWRLRTGRRQTIWVQLRAAAAAMRSERYLARVNEPIASAWDPISGFYATADDRFVQLHCNFPHHRDGVLRLLGCGPARDSVAAALLAHTGSEFENALAEENLCGALVRSPEEWEEHAQRRAVDDLPLLDVVKIGDGKPRPLAPAPRPLAGIRALDLTRVLAGPTCGRTLAEHGAEVLRVDAEHLPNIDRLVMDTGHGKRSTYIDLEQSDGQGTLRELIRAADIFVQAYRPGSLARRGFSPETLAEEHDGLVYVSVSAYGHTGPWANRRGFDTLVQSTTGIAHTQGIEGPRHLPGSVLDYTTGYIAAFGAMIALARRAERGGSYLVRASLCQTAHWLKRLGVLDDARGDPRLRDDQGVSDVADFITQSSTEFGLLTHLKPALELSETRPYWATPVVPLGTHAARWQLSRPNSP